MIEPIILFDGYCLLCNAAVRTVIRNDPKGRFKLATLQSDAGRALLNKYDFRDNSDSVILIEEQRLFIESEAALRIARNLKCYWPLYWLMVWWPRRLRNAMYRIVARNRYRWFGRQDFCMVPDQDISSRFIEG
jgi:predicted DCC family thiol-disulfide oxidoreductase YuxK